MKKNLNIHGGGLREAGKNFWQLKFIVYKVPGAGAKLFEETLCVWPGNGATCWAPRVVATYDLQMDFQIIDNLVFSWKIC